MGFSDERSFKRREAQPVSVALGEASPLPQVAFLILNLPAARGPVPRSRASHTCVAGRQVARNGHDAGRTHGDLGPWGLPGCGWSPLRKAPEPSVCEIQEEPQLSHRESWSRGSPATSDLEPWGAGPGASGQVHLPPLLVEGRCWFCGYWEAQTGSHVGHVRGGGCQAVSPAASRGCNFLPIFYCEKLQVFIQKRRGKCPGSCAHTLSCSLSHAVPLPPLHPVLESPAHPPPCPFCPLP